MPSASKAMNCSPRAQRGESCWPPGDPGSLHKRGWCQLLCAAKANLLRLKQEIRLTREEAAAVDEGVQLLESLVNRLQDVPTPAGPTPNHLVRTNLR